MKPEKDDLLDFLDGVWARLDRRLDGLSDDEWRWTPSPGDPRISIRWRLEHIVSTMLEPRNWIWMGATAPTPGRPPAESPTASAAAARVELSSAYAAFRSLIAGPDVDLDERVGPAGGRFADASRRSFVLHLADELVHHAAEAALLRDLYAARSPLDRP